MSNYFISPQLLGAAIPALGQISNQLGDWICVEGDCKAGESMVRQMVATYESLTVPQPIQNAQGIWFIPDDPARDAAMATMRQRYAAPVEAIKKALSADETWARRWVPFHPNCCDIKRIGEQAQKLTKQMLKDAGAAGLPDMPIGGGPGPFDTFVNGLTKVVKVGAFIGATVLLVWGGIKVYEMVDRSRERVGRRRAA